MKERQKAILEFILEHQSVSKQQLLDQFQISKRTLYYDIENINYVIKGNGQVKNIDSNFCYIGNARTIQDLLRFPSPTYFDLEERKHRILYKILNQEQVTIEKLAEEFIVSKNTIVQTMDTIKKELKEQGLQLQTKGCYDIVGEELQIRNLYLLLMQEDNNLINTDTDPILEFERCHNLCLSDYATCSLAKFLQFLSYRFAKQRFVCELPYRKEVQQFAYYDDIQTLLPFENANEQAYVCAYIASLPSLNTEIENPVVEKYVHRLVQRFETFSAIRLERKEEFIKHIRHHLLSSYYRIKYHFPINNPTLQDIQKKHRSLFLIIKRILENQDDFPDFQGIREEEIGFITAYFGGYIKGSEQKGNRKNRVLLVCPHGLMVSKSLEVQLYNYIPTVDIVDAIALKDLSTYNKPYDYIISTIAIHNYENVIVVNPLLTKTDIDIIMEKLLHIGGSYCYPTMDELMQVIRRYSDIHDENRLCKALEHVLFRKKEKEIYQPMLQEVLTRSRIQVIDRVENWQQAIQIAAKPLLEEHAIEESYVDAMIESVKKHGPYIVLADYFALPHASGEHGVHEVAMSLLVVNHEVDLLGKPVRLFMVLATTDNTSHMKALASLSELLFEPENIKTFMNGDKEIILDMIKNHEK